LRLWFSSSSLRCCNANLVHEKCRVLSEAGPKEQKTGALSRELPCQGMYERKAIQGHAEGNPEEEGRVLIEWNPLCCSAMPMLTRNCSV
jgi:hypothetical protein